MEGLLFKLKEGKQSGDMSIKLDAPNDGEGAFCSSVVQPVAWFVRWNPSNII